VLVAGSGHDPQFAGMHMAMAMIAMLAQIEVERDIKALSIRVIAWFVKNWRWTINSATPICS
jgi:hypothetical protein